MRVILACCLILFLNCSCGYRIGLGEIPEHYETIAIPYVKGVCFNAGDHYGNLTADLIREISRSGALRYQECEADLTLSVTIIDYHDVNIGFRYDKDKEGELTNSIIPTETRIVITAEVCVIENASGCTILGPAQLSASVDFDHDYYFSPDAINVFSLGQLSDIDAAYDAAVQYPLYRALAEKITDYVIHSW